jgi:hypothetical protein
MKGYWDEYLESEKYTKQITPDSYGSEIQRNRNIGWFRHAKKFWDWRLHDETRRQ